MEFANQMKGLELPKAISFEQRYGFGPWEAEDGDPPEQAPAPPKQKGEWMNKAGDVVQAIPGLFCTFFPKRCRRPQGPSEPIIVQQANSGRDWLTTSLLVVIVLVLLVLILKK